MPLEHVQYVCASFLPASGQPAVLAQVMRQPCRFRQAVSVRKAERKCDGIFEPDPMTGAHEYRLHTGARPDNLPDCLVPVNERDPRPAIETGLRMRTHEPRLRHTETGPVNQKPEVAGKPESPGMGPAVGIADKDVRTHGQTIERRQHGRNLAEAQETGYVRIGDIPLPGDAVCHTRCRHRQHDHCRTHPLATNADVEPCHGFEFLRKRTFLEVHREFRLEPRGFPRREIPGMLVLQYPFHGTNVRVTRAADRGPGDYLPRHQRMHSTE